MKKKTVTIGALLLAMNSFSQTDTLASSVNGKRMLEFNYYTSEVENIIEPKEDLLGNAIKECIQSDIDRGVEPSLD